MAIVQTVLGPVPDTDLGRVLTHEHLLALEPGPFDEKSTITDEDRINRAVQSIRGLRERGYGTIVDVTPYGLAGRDQNGDNTHLLAEISKHSGIHIVSGSGVYLDTWAVPWADGASVDTLTERFIRDVTEGIGTTGIRAGVLGEQATGLGRTSDRERTCFRASARAAAATGVTLMTHTTHGTLALDQIAMLREEGVDLRRVVIGHMDTQLSVDYALEVLQAGVCIAIDTIGKQEWDFFLGPPSGNRSEGQFAKTSFWRSDEARADLVTELVDKGFTDRIVLSMDITGAETWMNPTTHGRLGYNYLDEVFRPMLLHRGVTADQYDQVTIDTPARLLALADQTENN
jgi:predicted metal-dependent phosphotriesterase family hydrolase